MAIQLDDLVARLRLDTSGLSSGLRSAQGQLSSVGASATRAGRQATIGLTAPLVGIAAKAVSLAGTFDVTMRQVGIATGGATDALSDLAIEMGAKTQYSASEAADSMLELAKGGMTAAQIKGGALAATMKLAAAGGVELADSATFVSNSMSAFGLKAADADKVTVALAGAANASSASVQSLGMGLAQAALGAKNAGLSLQETTGVLSLFDSQGLKGSDGGTSLKAMLNGLIPTTEKASVAMELANLNFVKADGSFQSVANIAEQLKRGLGGLTEAQRAQTLETIFGSDGQRAASILMNGGAAAVEKFTKASRDQTTTNKLASAAMSGVSGAVERAKGSLETAALTIGQGLAPYVATLAGYVERAANSFAALPSPVKKVVLVVAGLLAVIGPVLLVIGALSSGAGVVAGAFASLSAGVTAVGAAATAAGGGLAGVGAALGVIFSPVVLVVGGLALLAAGFVIAYRRSAEFRTQVQTALDAVRAFITTQVVPAVGRIQVAFADLATKVRPIVMQIVGVVRQNMPQILQTVRVVFATVKSIILGVMSAVTSIIKIAARVITALWNIFGSTILAVIKRVFPQILNVIQGVLKVIQGVVKVFTSVLKGDWSGMWDGIKQITSGAWQAIKGIFSGGVGLVIEVVKKLPHMIKGVFGAAATLLLSIGGDIVQGLVNGIKNAAGAVADAAAALVDKIPGAVKKIMGIASPSKVMKKIGEFISQGLAEGIAGGSKHVAAEMDELAELVAKAHSKRMTELVEKAGKALSPLSRHFDRLKRNLHDAQTGLAALEAARTAYENRHGALDAAGGDLGSLTFDEGTAVTVGGITDQLQNAATASAAFDQSLAALRDAGLSQNAIDQLIAKGPEAALAVAQAILAGGPAAIAQINALQDQIAASGLSIQAKASQTMYDAGVAAQQGLIDGLESQMTVLEDTMTKIAKAMVRAIRKALDINSPSRVMQGLGTMTGAGFAQGIVGTTGMVSRASDALASAAMPSTSALSRSPLGSSSFGPSAASVRVYIGERELTDIVRVEVDGSLSPLRQLARQGAI